MKNIKVMNSKTSKSGKSTNFNYEGQWYSVYKSKINEKIGNSSLEGKIIKITSHEMMGTWNMVRDFEVVKENNESVFNIQDIIEVESFKEKPIMQQVDSSLANTYEKIRETEFQDLETFSPLELIDNEYASSTNDSSFKVHYINEIKDIDETKNSHVSVMQNLITRGINPNTLNSNIDSLLFILLLDFYKRGYDASELIFVLPHSIKKYAENTKKEIFDYYNIFSTIANDFPEGLKSFVEKVKLKYQEVSNDYHVVEAKQDKTIFSIKSIERKPKHLPPVFIAKTNIKYKNMATHSKEVNKILKLVFYNSETKITELKLEQLNALDRLMNGQKNILAVLKTGFGKSLIYQFASILQPRIFLNVFPINSLIKDQSLSLKDDFNLTYIIDNEELKKINGHKLQKVLLSTKRLFLITPERLENHQMQDYFHSLHEMIGYMIFDEAHCISEWGHDFRPSYLMARHLMENLMTSDKLNVIALTATAAPHIQKDIAQLLSIDRRDIINIADSTGLDRKEIKYKIIKKEIYDFDQWNRSEKFAEIIDGYIDVARDSSKQGIAFFMRSGSDQDLHKEKYLIKNNAFSAFERLEDRSAVGLYTGKNKLIEDDDQQVSSTRFNEFQKLDFIMATKSFGMGINLKRCDYVLLTELPYSLEDLYQQSGRVGRMGQKSIVEIIYHNRSLLTPLDKQSPYQYFLKINDTRKTGQLNTIKRLIEIIYENEEPFILHTSQIYPTFSEDKQNFLKWSISHLITEFNIIDKYFVEYKGMFRIQRIGIYPKKLPPKEELLSLINKKNSKLGMDDSSHDLFEALQVYYNYYFDKLQNDKLIGINILISKLTKIDAEKEIDGGKLISDSLTDYYKTRVDDVDKMAMNIIDLMLKEADLEKLFDFFNSESKNINMFELMESISRYSINKEYIEVASLLVNHLSGEKILISDLSTIALKTYDINYLQDLKNEIIVKIFFYENREDEEWKTAKAELLKKHIWSDIEKKILIKNIMEELNGKNL